MKKTIARRVCSALLAVSTLMSAFTCSAAADEIVYGDLDGNGVVDAADALIVLRHAVGLITIDPVLLSIADVNKDGVIDSSDSLSNLRASVGLEIIDEYGVHPYISPERQMIKDVAAKLNESRTKDKLTELQLDNKVSSAAQVRANELKTTWDFKRPDGSSWETVLEEKEIYPIDAYSIKLQGVDYSTADAVVEKILSDDYFNSYIKNGELDRIGIAFTTDKDSGKYYWFIILTQDPPALGLSINKTALVNEVADKLNADRTSQKLSTIELNKSLCEAADIRASEIVTCWSADRPDGSIWQSVLDGRDFHPIKSYQIRLRSVDYYTSQSVLDAILSNADFKSYLRDGNINRMGIGMAKDEARCEFYWYIIFLNDPKIDYSTYAEEVLYYINIERKNNGLSALTLDKTLCEMADQRATETLTVWDHDRPDGTSFKTIFDEYSYFDDPSYLLYQTFAENIAKGQRSPKDVVEAWLNSEGHRANILNPKFKKMGVGLATQDDVYYYYWVQLFSN